MAAEEGRPLGPATVAERTQCQLKSHARFQVCDNDPRCRHAMSCSREAEREHCKISFSDICEWNNSSSFADLQGASRRRAPAAKRGALVSEGLLSRKRCGEATVGEMCMILEKTSLLRKGLCCTHDRECDLLVEDGHVGAGVRSFDGVRGLS